MLSQQRGPCVTSTSALTERCDAFRAFSRSLTFYWASETAVGRGRRHPRAWLSPQRVRDHLWGKNFGSAQAAQQVGASQWAFSRHNLLSCFVVWEGCDSLPRCAICAPWWCLVLGQGFTGPPGWREVARVSQALEQEKHFCCSKIQR